MHQPTTSTSATMPTLTQPACTGTGGNCTAVQIGSSTSPKVAVFARQGALLTAVSFTTNHAGTAQYAVAGLAAGSYNITNGSGSATCTVASGDNTCYFESNSGTVTIGQGAIANPPPIVNLSVTPTSGTAPLAVTASTAGSSAPNGSIASTSINFGDGTVMNAASGSHSYTSAGTYTVTATITNNLGVQSSGTATVNVSAASAANPVASLTVTPASGTAPVTVSATATGTVSSGTIASTSINFGDGTVINAASGSHTYSSAGTYTVTATVTGSNNLTGTATQTVTVATQTPPSVTLAVTPTSGTVPVTVSATATGTVSSGTITSTSINFGDGTVINAARGSHTYSNAGTYTVTATVTDSAGATGTATQAVTSSSASNVNCSLSNILCVGSGQKYSTIQAAANVAVAGNEVYVFNGTYAGFYTVNAGTTSAPITYLAQSTAVVINGSLGEGDSNGDAVEINQTNYITLNGFTVENAGRAGIRVATDKGVIVENNVVTNSNEWGIFTAFAPNVQLLNNTVTNTAVQHGIYVSNSDVPNDQPVIVGNTVSGSAQNGIQINGDCTTLDGNGVSDGVISGALIANNTVFNNAAKGLSLIDMQYSTVANNMVYNNGTAGGAAAGIHLAEQDTCTADPSNNNVVVNNTIVEPNMAAIRITNGTNNSVFNNVAVSGPYGTAGIIDETGGPNAIDSSSNIEQGTAGTLFINSSSNNYQLASGSAAIGAGKSSYQSFPAPTFDFSNYARPTTGGSSYDSGAYEYNSTLIPTSSNPSVSGLVASPATITSGGSTYLFWLGSGANALSLNQGIGTVTGSSEMVSPTATTTYTLTATNANGTSTKTATVTLPGSYVAPVAKLSVTPTSGIAPVTVSASTAGSTAGTGATIASTSINFGDGTTLAATSGSHIFSNAGTYTVTATVTDSTGATATATQAVTVTAFVAPVAKLSVTPTSGTAPLTVSASTSGSTAGTGATIASTSINFGDGTTLAAAGGSHSYTKAGTYTVTATVTDSAGATATATQTVTVTAYVAPVAKLSVTPTSGTAPVTVTASTTGSTAGTGATIASTSINFGDGTTLAAASGSHSYTKAGTYTATATVTDSAGATATATQAVTVTTYVAPVAKLSVTPTSGIAPVTVSASTAGSTAGTGATIASTSINFGDGTTLAAASGSHTYTKAGTYTVTATVTDSAGATATATQAVTVTAYVAPVAKLSVTPTSGIAPVTVSASTAGSTAGTGATIASTSINFGDGTTLAAASGSHTYTKAGTYTVTATVTDSAGATATATQAVTVTAYVAPVAKLSVTPTSGTAPLTVSASTSGSTAGTGATIASTSINFGDGTTLAASSGSHIFSNAGTFTVTATVTDSAGATAMATQTVTVTGPATSTAPATMATPVAGSILPGSSVTFNWTGGTNVSQYQLQISTKSNTSGFSVAYTGTGTSATVSGLPINGKTVYVKLLSLNSSSTWLTQAYTYTASSACGTMSLGQGASLNGYIPFATGSLWRKDISASVIDSNSATLINSIGSSVGLHPDFGSGTYDGSLMGIPYIIVDTTQAMVNVSGASGGGEGDPSAMPIPADAPIEGYPNAGDNHVLVLQSGSCWLYELYQGMDSNGNWSASFGTVWDLLGNEARPYTWSSSDAAGLPIFEGLVRYDEVASGKINHAIRITLPTTRQAFVAPATHWASTNTSSSAAPMGMRIRLKANFEVSGYSATNQVILNAMKQYGVIVADNGSAMYISGAPDSRWNNDDLHLLNQITAADFDVVKMGTIYTPSNIPQGSAPTITNFATSSQGVAAGSPVTLSWNVSGASYVFISPTVGPVRGNSVTFTPTQTATYTIYATNQYGRTTATVTVDVQ